MAAAAAYAALRKNIRFIQVVRRTFSSSRRLLAGSNHRRKSSTNRSLFGFGPGAVDSHGNVPHELRASFSARTSARGVLPQAVGKFVHVYDPRSLVASKSAMLAGALPPAHPGTLAAPQHVTELNPTNALCGDDVRNAGPKKSREMASEAYRDNSGGGSCCHAAQRTRPGIGATAPIRAAASLHHQ